MRKVYITVDVTNVGDVDAKEVAYTVETGRYDIYVGGSCFAKQHVVIEIK